MLALISGSTSQAGTVFLPHSYWGGDDTYNVGGGPTIGDSYFNISGADISRTGPHGNTLVVTIDTPFAGYAGREAGTGYGALFITPGYNVWNPSGVGPTYSTDVYTPGEWQYALTIRNFLRAIPGPAAFI